jgi:hypothetical protein
MDECRRGWRRWGSHAGVHDHAIAPGVSSHTTHQRGDLMWVVHMDWVGGWSLLLTLHDLWQCDQHIVATLMNLRKK